MIIQELGIVLGTARPPVLGLARTHWRSSEERWLLGAQTNVLHRTVQDIGLGLARIARC